MENLQKLSNKLRKEAVDIIMAGNTGHIGGDMSVIDILTVLYCKVMNISPNNIDDENRDRFILSKGHCMEAYYAVLCEKGFLNYSDVKEKFSKFGSPYIGHPNNHLPGIEVNTGSLGHGLPVAVGMALAGKRDHKDYRVYVVLGDGELAEGSNWEGFMSGSMYGLDNLCAVIDRNGLQISGTTENVMALENLQAKIESFGWNVIVAENGNDINLLVSSFEKAKQCLGKPTCIIARTTKGCGSKVMENKAEWHHKVPTSDEYVQIMHDLDRR